MNYFKIILIFFYFVSASSLIALNGNGTKDDPYQITNINEFQNIKVDMSSWDKYFKLMNDIDASETRYWNVADHDGNPNTPDEPMGFIPIERFLGYLNGNGFIIYNLYINLPKGIGVGLFRFFYGVHPFSINLRRLGLENCNITGRYYVGCLAGTIEGGFIDQCFTHGKVSSADTLEWEWEEGIGGFCGNINYGRIENCYSSCTVTSIGEEHDYQVGSFCSGQLGSILNCYTTGKIISQRKATAFGDIGYGENCYWDVETTGIPDDGGNKAKGYSTSEMKKQATYIGFGFRSIWCIDEGRDYPQLRAFPNKCKPDVFPKEPFINVSYCDFGDVPVNETAADSVIIKNTGKEELVITGYSDTHRSPAFTYNLPVISEATPLRLAPNQSFTFEVTFRPTDEKTYTDSIFFISNTEKTFIPDSVAELLGKGIIPKEPEISVTDGNLRVLSKDR